MIYGIWRMSIDGYTYTCIYSTYCTILSVKRKLMFLFKVKTNTSIRRQYIVVTKDDKVVHKR